MKKIDQIRNILIGRNLRASTIYRETGLDKQLVYNYLNLLHKRGEIKRTNNEPPYKYTADKIPMNLLRGLWNIVFSRLTLKVNDLVIDNFNEPDDVIIEDLDLSERRILEKTEELLSETFEEGFGNKFKNEPKKEDRYY